MVISDGDGDWDVSDRTMTSVPKHSSLGRQDPIVGSATSKIGEIGREAGLSFLDSVLALIQGYEAVLKDATGRPSAESVANLRKGIDESKKAVEKMTKGSEVSSLTIPSLEKELEVAKAVTSVEK